MAISIDATASETKIRRFFRSLLRGCAVCREHSLMLVVLGAFSLAIVFVNPFREAPISDEWAYFLMVEHVLNTGQYLPHGWISANMVFQAYWGALFSSVLGHSFGTLRISTICLTVLGLIAFYKLARLHGLDSFSSGFLTLVLLSSPAFLLNSMTFMTDIPGLALSLTSLALYTVALDRKSFRHMIIAAVVATAAILTRQVAISVPVGVFLVFLMRRDWRDRPGLVLTALFLPACASVYQLWEGLWGISTWCMEFTRNMQRDYLGDKPTVLAQLIWRPEAALQYISLFSAPVLLVAFAAVFRVLLRRAPRAEYFGSAEVQNAALSNGLVTVLVITYLLGAILVGHLFQIAYRANILMPYMEPTFSAIHRFHLPARAAITLFTFIGAVVYATTFVGRYRRAGGWMIATPGQRLLDMVTAVVLFYLIAFFQIHDRYVVMLLPYAFVVLGLRFKPAIQRLRYTAICSGFVMLILSCLWARTALEYEHALWKGATIIQNTGTAPERIAAGWTWHAYHGFDDFLDQVKKRGRADRRDFYGWWLPEMSRHCTYAVVKSTPDGFNSDEWEIIGDVPYRNFFLRERKVLLLRKKS